MELEPNTCKNCGQTTTGAYCGNCGQRSAVYKVTFRETFNDLADNLFSISAPLPRTLKYLIADPGKLLRDYLEGKRKSYYKPISFFILATVFYLFIRWLIDFDIRGTVVSTDSAVEQMGEDNIIKARDFMFRNINNLLFFFVLSMSLALKTFFYRKYLLSEYIAVSFYLVGFYSLMTAFNVFYIKYVDPGTQYLAILAMAVYFIYAMIRFFNKGPIWVGIKSLIVYFLAYLGYGFLAFGFSFLIVVLNT